MNRFIFFVLSLCIGCDNATAQTTSATLFGIGAVNHLDSYLSPLNYTGTQLHFLHESWRPTHLLDSCISFQSFTHVETSLTQNDPNKANDIGGTISYDATWHYRLPVTETGRLLMLAGPQIGGTLGALYNTRNGNNPAQAIAELHLAASVAALYSFRLWQHSFVVRDQVDIPLLGAMFSPAYGQSYYELFSLGHRDHNICFTNPFNAPSLRNQLTLDFPICNHTFRVGYLIDIRQSHVNDILRHTYSHAFLIGWVRHFRILPHREAQKGGFIF